MAIERRSSGCYQTLRCKRSSWNTAIGLRGSVPSTLRPRARVQAERKDDPVADMVDLLTRSCARLYCRRGAENRAAKALAAHRLKHDHFP
jgi:hypothetical protein